MRSARPVPTWKVVTVIVAVLAFGLAVRLLLVSMSANQARGTGVCEVVTDFWDGDQVLC